MESHAKAAGHAIHQQLIAFPLGLLATAVVFDIIQALGGGDGFATASYYMIAAGIISGLLAALFGVIDYLAIPSATRAKRIGLLHGAGNVVVIALFAVSWFARPDDLPHDPNAVALTLSVVAGALAGMTAWLGGERVDRLGVGIDDDANLDAPASFKTGIDLRKHEQHPAPR